MLKDEEYLFVQYKLKEHRNSFINGELRITQQQYYRYLRSAVSDSFEGEQLVHAKGKAYTLFGNHSTYIWSCSIVDRKNLSSLKKFDDYNFGILILEPDVFVKQTCNSLLSNPILENCSDIAFDRVIYTNEGQSLTEDKNKPLSRWTKHDQFSDENEYRLCVHNVPPMENVVEFFPNEVHRIEEVYTPSAKALTKQTFHRLIFNVAFEFNYELYKYNGKLWVKDN